MMFIFKYSAANICIVSIPIAFNPRLSNRPAESGEF
jgi:hypothetical protein